LTINNNLVLSQQLAKLTSKTETNNCSPVHAVNIFFSTNII